jgi:tetratricopeptide (TPR) repeat protein
LEGSIIAILLFGSNHIDLITGKKTTTIRQLWKKPLSTGDRLHCYWNLISKEREKLFEAEVIDVDVLKFRNLKENDDLAHEEGFCNAQELESEFHKLYPDIKDDSLFQVIRFRKLPINKWEGKKIDEKEQISKRADNLFDIGKFNASVQCYSAALRFEPNDVYLLNRKGDNLSRLGLFDEALECYDKALKLDSQNEFIWNNKAIALLNSNKPKEALKTNNEALKLNSENILVLYWRGFILEMLGRYDEALEYYDKIIVIDPNNPDVWNARGNILTEMDRAEEALESYDRGLEVCLDDAPDASTWNRKGNALMELGRFEEAVKCYNESLKLKPKNDIFLSNKAVAYIELTRFKEAMDCLRKALMINPENEDAQILRDECLDNL